ncbi:hypothetical protein [Streptomyces sp. NPDC001985]|uniref:hypothetical protein n=1 Tax=Streptomyces sp. NPDC001985 TaxID=3154406 RepID=UPI00332B014E
MTLRKANVVVTVVCALAGAGLVAGRGWAEGPVPLDIGPVIRVPAGHGPLPPATARPVPPSPMTPVSPSASQVPTRTVTPRASAPPRPSKPPSAAPSSARPQGGRPVRTLPPAHSSDEEDPFAPDLGDEEGEWDDEDGSDGGGGGVGGGGGRALGDDFGEDD